eukprot:tig00000711_g3371.t1
MGAAASSKRPGSGGSNGSNNSGNSKAASQGEPRASSYKVHPSISVAKKVVPVDAAAMVDSFADKAAALLANDGHLVKANRLATEALNFRAEGEGEGAAPTLWSIAESVTFFKDSRMVKVAQGTALQEFAQFKCLAMLNVDGDAAEATGRTGVFGKPVFELEMFEVLPEGPAAPPAYLCFFRRLQERTDEWTRLQAAIQRSEMKRTALIDTSCEAVVIIDETGVIRSFNRHACNMFGYKEAEAVGGRVEVLMPPQFRKAHQATLDRYIETRLPSVIGFGREVPAVRSDGTLFNAQLAVSLPVVINGKHHFVGLFRETTKAKIAEKALCQNTAWVEELCFSGTGGPKRDIMVDMQCQVHYKQRKANAAASRAA